MSSTLVREWLVQIPDHPNAIEKRMKARPIHLKNLQPHIDSGRVVMGGAFLGAPLEEGKQPDMKGSFILVQGFDTAEEVKDWLKKDEYATSGTWDVDNSTVFPFRTAIRTALEGTK